MRRLKIASLLAVSLGALALLLLGVKRGTQLAAFQERLHMVERSLSAYQEEHGVYPDRLSQLTEPGFKVEDVLAGATYRYLKPAALAPSNQVLLDGSYRGYRFEITPESGVSFR